MPDRRMISRRIVRTDKFLAMPIEAQYLYMQLILDCDDDGFIENPKSVAHYVGCNQDYLSMLVKNQYLIEFASGTMLVRHWKMQNIVRKDRYRPSIVPERDLVVCDKNSIYMLDNSRVRDGCETATTMDTNGRPYGMTYGRADGMADGCQYGSHVGASMQNEWIKPRLESC